MRASVAAGLVALAALVAVARVTADDPPASPGRDQEVKRLLTDLGGPTRTARTLAEKRLLELGPSILPQLPAPELLATASLCESVERVRQELERRLAHESIRAAKVTLVGDEPLDHWLTEISLQTGNKFESSDLPDEQRNRRVALHFHESEFWPVVDDLAARCGFRFEPDAVPGRIRLLPATAAGDEPPSLVIGYSGPFRLSAPPARCSLLNADEAAAGRRPPRRLVRILLTIEAEPRLRPLFLQFLSKDIEADRPGGQALAPFSPDANYDLPAGDGSGRSRLQLDYVLTGDNLPARIDLAGRLQVTTAAGSAALRFPEIGQRATGKPVSIERRRGGVTVTLQGVRREKNRDGAQELSVRAAVTYDSGGPAFESHRTWILHNAAYLEETDGGRVTLNGGYETTLQADGAVGMQYRFIELPDPLPGYAFVYVAPTMIIDVPVPFALKSVPLQNE